MVRKDFAGPDPYLTHILLFTKKSAPPACLIWVWGDCFSQCRCVGALAPRLLVLVGSGRLFFSMPVCGCTCTLPARLIGFWEIIFLNAGVWVHLHPARSSYWVLGDCFTQCRCVGALAPRPLVLLGSGGLFYSTLVCGCACTPPARLVGFWGIAFLDAGVWARLRPSLRYTIFPHLLPHPVVTRSPAIQRSGAKSGQATCMYIHAQTRP